MAFWSTNSVKPLRKRSFRVSIPDAAQNFEFLVKSANKPTVETDVNEYRLINQIKKFPTVPKWNDITIKYVDTAEDSISKKLYEIFFDDIGQPEDWKDLTIGCPQALSKADIVVIITQYDAEGSEATQWELVGTFIKSINFGDLDYSSDDFVEVEVVMAYDYAQIIGSAGF